MGRKKVENRNTRNLQKSRGSYSISLPIDFIRSLGWQERQKLVVKKIGKKLQIEDWEA
ncbi:MAG: hypothetical protein Q8Q32_00020 [bacterium]|nr:hypothetical protein [bacterium]